MPDIISQLKALKLHGMAECYAEIQAQNPELMTSVAVILRQLLEAEVMDRSIRTIRYQMGSARLSNGVENFPVKSVEKFPVKL